MKNVVTPLTAAALALSAVSGIGGWYLAAHPRGHRHFDTCRLSSDGMLVLGYEYGAGDRVTASVQPTDSAVVVRLSDQAASGPHPAIALHGELRFDTFGGVRDRPVKDANGTALPCSEEA